MELVLRRAVPADRNFVLSSWMKSYRGSRYFDAWNNERYYSDYDGFQAYCKRLLDRHETRLVIAHLEGDPDEIVGWAAGEPPHALYYVYVKKDFRNASTPAGEEKLDIAKRLVKSICPRFGSEETVCACTAPGWAEMRQRFRLVFNPYV